jgi:hypothetical protein
VHHDDDADAGRSRVSFTHQSGPAMFGGRKARAWKRGTRVARSARKTKKK